jgi:hypothetical protein
MDAREDRKDLEAARLKRQLEQTAAGMYADRRKELAVLLDDLQVELEAHARRAAKKPGDWSYPGDLLRIRAILQGILQSLLIGRHGWTASEAARFIADRLDQRRDG